MLNDSYNDTRIILIIIIIINNTLLNFKIIVFYKLKNDNL